MDGETKYYQKASRDRNRFLLLGYSLHGVPVDEEHAAYLEKGVEKEVEKHHSKKQAADGLGESQSSQSKHTPQKQQAVPHPSSRPSPGSQSPSPSDGGNATVPSRSTIQDDGSVLIRDRHGHTELLPKNVWPVLLLFEDRSQFEGEVLLDTGAEDNWISRYVVDEHKLPWQKNESNEDDEETFEDFSGQKVKSCGVVRAQWIYRHRTIPVKFKIAPTAPWQVLFGFQYLLQTQVLTINQDNTNGWVAPLVKSQEKPSAADKEQIAKNEDSIKAQATRIEHYRRWKVKMQSENWTWDKEHNNFFTVTDRGNKEWCKDGYQINFRVDDALQSN